MQIRIAVKKMPSIATPGLGRDLATAMVGSRRIPMVITKPQTTYTFNTPALTDGPLGQSIQAASPNRRATAVTKGLFQ